MMKKPILFFLCAALLLFSCAACGKTEKAPAAPDSATSYLLTEIDRCVVEPDVRDVMTDADRAAYRALMDAVIARKTTVVLSTTAEKTAFLLDQLRRSPYYFFVSSAEQIGGEVRFDYAYGADEQNEMLRFMDDEFLAIVNENAAADDNELDTILKLYYAVTSRLEYDHDRTDNKELGSPLFDYPADEIYKALRDRKSLCYGFAYILRFAFLQRGVDCFCVYGECRAHDVGHEWLMFRYKDHYYHCDPAWDRAVDGSPKLVHFGKTDKERVADTLVPRDFAEYHLGDYRALTCADKTFNPLRGVCAFEYLEPHRFYVCDVKDDEYVFDTRDLSLTRYAADEG